MDKIILYFTRKERLSDLGIETRKIKPLLAQNGELELFKLPSQSPRLLLVYDQFNLEEFKNKVWPNIHKIKEFAFVYHTDPNSEIIDFLHERTNLSQKGSHEEDMEGYEYYAPLKIIITSQEISDEVFNELWQKLQHTAQESEKIDQLHSNWLNSMNSMSFIKTPQTEQKIIYIDNIPEPRKKQIESYGIEVKSPTEIIDYPLNNETALVILCEINIDTEGNREKRTDFYGIELSKKLRRENFKGNILFVSFKKIGFFLENDVKYKLLSIKRGHSFSQLPNQLSHLLQELSKIQPLNDLSFRDLQLFSINISGFLSEQLHRSKESIDYHAFHRNLLKQVYGNYQEPVITVLKTYNEISKYQEAKSFTKYWCEKIIEKHGEETQKGTLLPQYSWSILWLDDEVSRIYEKGKTVEVIERLSTERGINVIKVGSFEEAVEKWNYDRATTQSITAVVTDYRLDTITEEGFTTQNIYQGYDFLEKVAKEENTLALFVYSGMPRKFLMETFSYYGKKIRFFSKADFPIEKISSFNFICDEIVVEGDEAWIGINNQPASKEWTKTPGRRDKGKKSSNEDLPLSMSQVYFQFKKSIGEYTVWNKKSNITTAKNIEEYERGEFIKFDITTSEFPSSAKSQLKVLKNILLVRRFAITVLMKAYLKNENLIDTKKKIGEYIHTCSNIKSSFNPKTPDILFNRVALDVTDFPSFLLADEYTWLKYDCKLEFKPKEFIDNYFKTLSQIKEAFSKVYNQFSKGFLQGLIDNSYYNIQQKHVANSEFEKAFIKDETKQIFFDSSYQPKTIRTVAEIKSILYFIHFNLNASNKKKYQVQLLEFSTLLSEVSTIVNQRGNNCPKSLATLFNFIDNLPAKTKGQYAKYRYNKKQKTYLPIKKKETIKEEHTRLFAPWELALPYRHSRYTLKQYEKVCEKRKINMIKACESFNDFATNSWKGYEFIKQKYGSIKNNELTPHETKTNKAIYYGILEYFKDRNKKIETGYKEILNYDDEISTDSSQLSEKEYKKEASSDNFILKYDSRIKDSEKDNLKQTFLSFMNEIELVLFSETDVRLITMDNLPKGFEKVLDVSKVSSNYLAYFKRDDETLLDDETINKVHQHNLAKDIPNYYVFSIPNPSK